MALAPPRSRLRFPPPARTPTPMSPTRMGVARLQLALEQRVDQGLANRLDAVLVGPDDLLAEFVVVDPDDQRRNLDRAVVEGRLRRPLDVDPDRRQSRVDDAEDALRADGTADLGEVDRRAVHREGPHANVPDAVLAPPVCCVAAQCRPPRTTAPPASEICLMSAVAVAVRVALLSIEAWVVEVRPLTLSKPPGTAMLFTVVVASDVGRVVAFADSFPMPRPSGDACGVMLLVCVWFPLVDLTCTAGGTSLGGSVGLPPLHPWASSAVPIAAEVDGLRERLRLHVLVVGDGRRQRDGVVQAARGGRQA